MGIRQTYEHLHCSHLQQNSSKTEMKWEGVRELHRIYSMFDNDESVFAVTSNLQSLAGVFYKKRFHSWLIQFCHKISMPYKNLFWEQNIPFLVWKSFSMHFPILSQSQWSREGLDSRCSRMFGACRSDRVCATPWERGHVIFNSCNSL